MSLKGLLGLDDASRLLDELAAETGLRWHEEPVEEGKVLSGGLVEILLVAVASKTAEMAYEAAMERAKQVVERWREERLDKPEASVRAESLPDSEATGAEGLDS
ncbi:hypothetical protein P3T37_007028 [Kitasatospora sp. MAA4]|uniref:hypothetical protein n=1 Tax=Kitasatospora sp. MAA4 TaxID=3035093 RepID=UPI002474B0C6|nr:hypothetical protein [Kitasatospora sp. MAA4]MDH6137595.1 hypothetical protein [Kitasatospora sp. MAA4]